jgi:hypothetical protein
MHRIRFFDKLIEKSIVEIAGCYGNFKKWLLEPFPFVTVTFIDQICFMLNQLRLIQIFNQICLIDFHSEDSKLDYKNKRFLTIIKLI